MDDFKDNSVTKEQQENDENPDAGIEAEVSGTTVAPSEPETEKKTSEEKVSRGLLGKRAAEPSPTDMQPALKKQKLEEIKIQDVANAAPPQAEGSASKKEEQAPNTPPGTSKTSTGPDTPPGKPNRFSPHDDMLLDSINPNVNFTSVDGANESETGSDTEEEFRRVFAEENEEEIQEEFGEEIQEEFGEEIDEDFEEEIDEDIEGEIEVEIEGEFEGDAEEEIERKSEGENSEEDPEENPEDSPEENTQENTQETDEG